MMIQPTPFPIPHVLPPEVCAHCGHVFAGNEVPDVWRENVVCAACHAKLLDEQIFRAFAKAVPPGIAAMPPLSPRLGRSGSKSGCC